MSLRDATGPQHEAVDGVYSGFDLSDPAGYGRFLRAQSACVTGVEAALAERAQALLGDWAARARGHLLAADLADLGLTSAPPEPAPVFADEAAVLGGVYVLEGSRFGGAMLSRQLFAGAPARFLGRGVEPNSWRSFIAVLDRHLSGEAAMASAIAAARSVFASFERAGRQELELRTC